MYLGFGHVYEMHTMCRRRVIQDLTSIAPCFPLPRESRTLLITRKPEARGSLRLMFFAFTTAPSAGLNEIDHLRSSGETAQNAQAQNGPQDGANADWSSQA